MKRREFIKTSALTTVGTLWVPAFVKTLENNTLPKTVGGNKSLIIIQLGGGNDGLNTFVPFQNDIYYRERPQIAIGTSEVIKLNDELGLNPALESLRSIYEDGNMLLINNVGYPEPDRSHFRSMDIWQSASDASQYLDTGWVGRYLDATCGGTCDMTHQAIEIDDTLSLAMKGENIKGMAMQSAQKLYRTTQSNQMKYLAKQAHHHEHAHSPAAYLYKTLAQTVSSAAYIQEKTKNINTKADFPQNEFGKRLKTISELLQADLQTRVYYASLSGFDTHVNQKNTQERLLKIYADAVQALVADLKKNGKLADVLILTFSEFGRRVKQNGSAGTDHGTANNVWLIGGGLKKAGVFNEAPNLSNLQEGDLKHSVDFRSIYATILSKHFGVDDKIILGKNFEKLTFI